VEVPLPLDTPLATEELVVTPPLDDPLPAPLAELWLLPQAAAKATRPVASAAR
jgi:hypothetical protein